MVPRSRTVVVFTADHGVVPFPEATGKGGRATLRPVTRDLARAYEPRFHTTFAFDAGSGLVTADVAALRSRGVNVDSLSRALARRIAGLPGVAKVFTPADLTSRARTDDDARLWRRTLPGDLGWLVAASLEPGWIWADGTGWTTHGSTASSDTHVPLIFLHPGVRGRRVARRVTTEDIGPTLAALAGVRPTEPVTGRVLAEVTGARK
jgi:arylsulfatase A-like enzyme